MLIEDGDRLILIDTGLGDKQSEKFFSYYFLFGDDSLKQNLKQLGFSPDDVTDVILTHLHFDHCGGAIERNQNGDFRPTFKNATYWNNQENWDWAINPNTIEKASFLKENILPIQESGQLKFLDKTNGILFPELPKISFHFFDGHTESQMIPHISYKGEIIVFMADLLPSVGHIPLPYVMGYDTRPLITLTEMEKFLHTAASENYILFLEHDSQQECCTVQLTEKGVRLKETFIFNDRF
jgi:glyoxylase-like metal-dependent hydrolase (beta-lactamase superfamily II)